MHLSKFIEANLDKILADWEAFARTLMPDASVAVLRDHAASMLQAIAADMETPQTRQEQQDKSHGLRTFASRDGDSAAQQHGTNRQAEGIAVGDMISEFRALRASVLRLWAESAVPAAGDTLEEMTRFNEAIDEAVAESVGRFTEQVDHARDLLLAAMVRKSDDER